MPVPYEPVLLGRRKAGHFPGTISTILETNALNFLDPSDGLLDDFLELAVEGERIGKRPYGCPLFNVHISDGHFSALGSRSWASIVGERLELLLEWNSIARRRDAPSEGLTRDEASLWPDKDSDRAPAHRHDQARPSGRGTLENDLLAKKDRSGVSIASTRKTTACVRVRYASRAARSRIQIINR